MKVETKCLKVRWKNMLDVDDLILHKKREWSSLLVREGEGRREL